MANKHPELCYDLAQDLGYDYVEIEFVLEECKESPKIEEELKKPKYELSPAISRKELGEDRRKRQKSYIKYERPLSLFSIADSRIFR